MGFVRALLQEARPDAARTRCVLSLLVAAPKLLVYCASQKPREQAQIHHKGPLTQKHGQRSQKHGRAKVEHSTRVSPVETMFIWITTESNERPAPQEVS